jgi:hypothetical protein
MGCPGYAIRAIENPEILDTRKQTIDDLIRLLAQNRAGRFAYVEEVTRKKNLQILRKHVEDTLIAWGSLWRDVFMQLENVETVMHNPDRRVDIENLASRLDNGQVIYGLNKTMESIEAIQSFGNVRIVLETLLLNVPRV